MSHTANTAHTEPTTRRAARRGAVEDVVVTEDGLVLNDPTHLELPGHGNSYKLKPNGVSLLEVATLTTLQGQVAADLCGGVLDNAGVYLYPARGESLLPYLGLNSDATSGGPIMTALLQAATDSTAASYRLDYVNAGSYDLQLVCNASEDQVLDSGSSDFIPTIGSSQLGISVDPAVANPQIIDLIEAPAT